MTAYKPWTKDQVKRLKAMKKRGDTTVQIAEAFGRPLKQIQNKLYRMTPKGKATREKLNERAQQKFVKNKLSKRASNFNAPNWTEDENRQLDELYTQNQSVEHISKELGRSEAAVRARAKVLGIKRAGKKKGVPVHISVEPSLHFGAQVIDYMKRIEEKLDAVLAGKTVTTKSDKYAVLKQKLDMIPAKGTATIEKSLVPSATFGGMMSSIYSHGHKAGKIFKTVRGEGCLFVVRIK